MAHKNKSNISPYKTRKENRHGDRSSPPPKQGVHRKPQVIYELEEASDRLGDLFRHHQFADIPYSTVRQFAVFYRLLMEQQKSLNLTRLLELREVGMKHFIDSMMPARMTKLQFPLLDLGTGPGFPGLPLKFLFPGEKIILAEGVQKRVEFLKKVREEMQLQNLPIIGRNINPWFFYPVNGVITRAVEDVRNTLKNVIHCLQTGGKVYFMKGPQVDPEMAVAEQEVGEYYRLEMDHHYKLPGTQLDRRLLVYQKIKVAPFPDLEDEPFPGENVLGKSEE